MAHLIPPDNYGTILFYPQSIENYHQFTSPIPARFVSGHFFFTVGHHCVEYKYDPEIYFAGDEISLSIRSFTLGYDIYHPHKTVIWHEYTREGRKKHWDDFNDVSKTQGKTNDLWHELDSHSKKRLRHMLQEEDNQIDLGSYGLGNVRTHTEFERYAGICFAKRQLHPKTVAGSIPPVNDDYSDWQEETEYKLTLTIPYPNQPFDNLYIGIENEVNNLLLRKDFSVYEQTVEITLKSVYAPTKWVYWVQNKGIWGERIDTNLIPGSKTFVSSAVPVRKEFFREIEHVVKQQEAEQDIRRPLGPSVQPLSEFIKHSTLPPLQQQQPMNQPIHHQNLQALSQPIQQQPVNQTAPIQINQTHYVPNPALYPQMNQKNIHASVPQQQQQQQQQPVYPQQQQQQQQYPAEEFRPSENVLKKLESYKNRNPNELEEKKEDAFYRATPDWAPEMKKPNHPRNMVKELQSQRPVSNLPHLHSSPHLVLFKPTNTDDQNKLLLQRMTNASFDPEGCFEYCTSEVNACMTEQDIYLPICNSSCGNISDPNCQQSCIDYYNSQIKQCYIDESSCHDNCFTEGNRPTFCSKNSSCPNKACGRLTAAEYEPDVCCPSNKTFDYFFYDYCTGMKNGDVCWQHDMCESGYCQGNWGGLKKGMCNSKTI